MCSMALRYLPLFSDEGGPGPLGQARLWHRAGLGV